MAENESPESNEDPPKKSGKKGVLIAMVVAALAGGGGFYASFSGALLSPQQTPEIASDMPATELLPGPEVAFISIQPLVINVGANGADRFLRFQAQLEVRPESEQEVSALMPRIVDVLNGYLRAVDVSELQKRAALVKLRAQMLRRIQVVTGEGRVRDLLIMEFVLS